MAPTPTVPPRPPPSTLARATLPRLLFHSSARRTIRSRSPGRGGPTMPPAPWSTRATASLYLGELHPRASSWSYTLALPRGAQRYALGRGSSASDDRSPERGDAPRVAQRVGGGGASGATRDGGAGGATRDGGAGGATRDGGASGATHSVEGARRATKGHGKPATRTRSVERR
ncbi:uncharacterized protein SCHCODRAFT_02179028 [Schizophyllum commune H4-8]|uniref:uncharacterized protein n=1 Tax=Schizophyllum commune (strain H4-8 / FGSC 9210) TaxID=578458 RepID=UPI002160403B|nr:uncharacterized protein SCHCODRAFT_02179028 [Schizophyllum commune H4-8]KAI5836637.1 hypothetical protein SCHCODRAFT_02179028 [Schizophyllum commune H4-8]